MQEYTTYSEKLIARNREFFESGKAPEFLLFEPGSIDGRHPASAEGSLWPLFLERYAIVDSADEMLVLRKREAPLPSLGTKEEIHRARMGRWHSLPNGRHILFVKLDIRPTLLGRLFDFVFRPPEVRLSVAYASGRFDDFRIIPGQASEGMILSPRIGSSLEYLLVANAETSAAVALEWATRIRIDVGSMGRLAYSRKVAVSVQEIDKAILERARNPNLVASLEPYARILPLLAHNELDPSRTIVIDEGVYAHAASTLLLPTGTATRMDVSFGLRSGDYRNFSESDGVCFTIGVQGASDRILERCLNPRQSPADEGLHTATLAVPPDSVLELKTECRANCAYDWSYWGGVRLND